MIFHAHSLRMGENLAEGNKVRTTVNSQYFLGTNGTFNNKNKMNIYNFKELFFEDYFDILRNLKLYIYI